MPRIKDTQRTSFGLSGLVVKETSLVGGDQVVVVAVRAVPGDEELLEASFCFTWEPYWGEVPRPGDQVDIACHIFPRVPVPPVKVAAGEGPMAMAETLSNLPEMEVDAGSLRGYTGAVPPGWRIDDDACDEAAPDLGAVGDVVEAEDLDMGGHYADAVRVPTETHRANDSAGAHSHPPAE